MRISTYIYDSWPPQNFDILWKKFMYVYMYVWIEFFVDEFESTDLNF